MTCTAQSRPKLAISTCLLEGTCGSAASALRVDVLTRFFQIVAPNPEAADICGCIICGEHEVHEPGRAELPMEAEHRLADPIMQENFFTRVFACADWQTLCRSGLSRSAILDFHVRYKYQLLAHSRAHYRELGRLLAQIGEQDPQVIGPHYFALFMQGLGKCANRGSHSNVLQHLAGYLKRVLPADEKRALQQLIERYRLGAIPLAEPLALLKLHFRHHPDDYIARQAYLQPHPAELGLRNSI